MNKESITIPLQKSKLLKLFTSSDSINSRGRQRGRWCEWAGQGNRRRCRHHQNTKDNIEYQSKGGQHDQSQYFNKSKVEYSRC